MVAVTYDRIEGRSYRVFPCAVVESERAALPIGYIKGRATRDWPKSWDDNCQWLIRTMPIAFSSQVV